METPLLLVHPTGTSSWSMRPVRDALARPAVCLDRPGWGAARLARPRDYAAQGAWLAARIREPCDLFAWSSGAFVALHAALLSEHVGTLHLYEPPFGSSRDHDDERALLSFAAVLGWAAVGRHDRSAHAFFRMVSTRRDGTCGFDRLDRSLRARLGAERGPLVRELLAGTGEELAPRLRDLRAQVRILIGAESAPAAHRAAARLTSAIDGAKTRELPDVDHLGPLTHPSLVAQALQ